MKVKRQSKILELIRENDIETQEMLADLLNKAGFNVTQATVSRDIRELKLTKATMQSGKQKYVATAKESSFVTERLNRVFRDGIVSIDYAQNIVVIKTLVGMAMAVAAALDSMENSEIMGTIAGDDTIFCVVKNESKAVKLTENLKVDFKDGLNVLSGETGAGKSIVIGSLNFVLGGKADKTIVKKGCDTAEVSALIYVENKNTLDILKSMDVEIDDDNYILLKRTFNTKGKSYCKINGSPATVSMIRNIASHLVDIHGQHDHQSLLNPKSHITLLDRLCEKELDEPMAQLSKLYNQYKEITKVLREIDINDKDIADRVELYKYQIDEITSANLKIGEDEELHEKRKILSNSHKLHKLIDDSLNYISRSSGANAMDCISYAIDNLNTIAEIDEDRAGLADDLHNIYAYMEDIVNKLSHYADTIESNPEELSVVEDRLQLIYDLKKKYGNTIEDINKFKETVSVKLEKIENSEELLKEYLLKKQNITAKIQKICLKITQIRKEKSISIEKNIKEILRDLSMPNAEFKVSIEPKDGFDKNGADIVEFMFSANIGEDIKPLSKIASGGEMSRMMLALKTVLADVDNIETFIFDEIDTGISGRAAQKVAEKMCIVAKKHQILCITHLPQIAAMADYNFVIEKIVENNTAKTIILELSPNKVYNEIARLIGGTTITDVTVDAAKEMKILANKLKGE